PLSTQSRHSTFCPAHQPVRDEPRSETPERYGYRQQECFGERRYCCWTTEAIAAGQVIYAANGQCSEDRSGHYAEESRTLERHAAYAEENQDGVKNQAHATTRLYRSQCLLS